MGKPVQISITSDPVRLAEVRIAVEQISRDVGFTEDEVSKLVLAVDEALANVIRHGYEGQGGQPIELVFETEPDPLRDGLEIRIRDYGRRADLKAICSRDLDDVRPGGLGVHLIESAMDEVEYSHPPGGGMQLRLRKYLRGNGG